MTKLNNKKELAALGVVDVAIIVIVLVCAFAVPAEKKSAAADNPEVIKLAVDVPEEMTTEIQDTESESPETEESIEHTSEILYTNTRSNIRAGAGLDQEVLETVNINTQLTVIDYNTDDEWSFIEYADGHAYIFTELLSYTATEIKELPKVKYYGIWSGAYWHFTPEEIDNQWNGMKRSKPQLPSGTTRAWQKYLFDKLTEIGCEWFYKYAVAQAMQESGFNPMNQMGNDSVPDKGLFSFRIWYWNSAYGDIYDYHANINEYIARILPYLNDSSEQGVYRAISQHYQPDGTIHMDYVQHVLGRLNELWEVE